MRHPISSLWIEHHPYLVQPGLVDVAQKLGIDVMAYSYLGPQSFLELPSDFSRQEKGTMTLFEIETVKGLAEKYAVTPSQVLLR